MSDTGRKTERTMQIDRSTIAEQMRRAGKREKIASFVVLGGMDVGSVLRFDGAQIVIGRDPRCDITVRDDGISRQHAKVERIGQEQIIIRDLDSTNGTFVSGERIKEAVMSDGDKVLLGRRTVLKFVLQDEIEINYQKQMYESSTRDGLTGIYNRKYFMQKMGADLSFAKRHKVASCLLMMDIDHFKGINDTYGHRTGDQVLVSVTQIVNDMIRTEDVFARYGGEEFVLLARGTVFEGGKILSERIRKAVSEERFYAADEKQTGFSVTISIGVASVNPGQSVDPDRFIAIADKNLYEAKNGGRNRVVSSEILQRDE